ncbi:hypothetical protein KIW84_030005 [Lathyrus oleraceus]|uniref:Uncharacterized protein n=1 Tax=Pisum sativum TaxID=3888 RepID=A0A9D4XP89_PEA|nr:hypothetical protein KIW84_030005 [Pisum sativum]
MANSKSSSGVRNFVYPGKQAHALLPPKSPFPSISQAYADYVSNPTVGSRPVNKPKTNTWKLAPAVQKKKLTQFSSRQDEICNILKSKLVEFDKLLSEPYKMPLNSSLDIQKYQSNGANANAFSPATQNNGPLSVSSFSQLGASLNTGFERPSAPQVTPPAQPNSFGNGGKLFLKTTQETLSHPTQEAYSAVESQVLKTTTPFLLLRS